MTHAGRLIRYRPEIDGLRAIAVLAVVLYHAGLGGAGFVGVDVFFVISGYLITALLLQEHANTGTIDLLAFYARRVRRIFPAAAVVVIATLLASAVLLSPAQVAEVATSAGAALVFVSNVYFHVNSGGYFDAPAESLPLLHLWSLSVEEQFYLLWPTLLLFTRSRKVFVVLALASLALAEGWIAQGSDAAFYETPARFWELAVGGIIAASPARALPRWSATAGVIVTLAACAWPMPHFPGVGAVPAVFGAALLIAALHGGATQRVLASQPMVGVGLVSYSLYLWHWPLLALYRATTITQTMQVKLLLCGVALLLAIASYRYVEQPVRRMRWPKGRTVGIGAAVSFALALTACGYAWTVRPDQRFVAPDRRCHVQGLEAPVPKCALTEAVVWGDSMAYAWTPAFPEASSATRDACAPLLDHPDAKCRAFNARVLAALPKGATVILAARWQPGMALAPTLARLQGHRVRVLGPTPQMRKDVPTCIAQHIEAACAVPRAEFDAFAQPILAAMRQAAAPYPNVEVVDLTERFCTATTCPPVRDGQPLYWDTHHVSRAAAEGFLR
ncbi:hypothetical protein LYSHEL_30960 [Lysobacter helvus]|uniref:Acyltransferase n=2 Tax=Lysobacteraceae TaxID=32033 RepID=A0ABM7Q9D9_9GAMM|nr:MULTISPECIES: acyltransferase family protein [Lysobacter]BCT94069.1 hypothetical protein LYSCAS_30930 [Lysobacter caseinilyticus]BCT97225.1 hypothetical protein LYSHEL_30960 [Lysobacter helvus]